MLHQTDGIVGHASEALLQPRHVGLAAGQDRPQLRPDPTDLVVAGLRLHLQEEGQLGHPRLQLGLFVVASCALACLLSPPGLVGRLILLEGHVEISRDGKVVGRCQDGGCLLIHIRVCGIGVIGGRRPLLCGGRRRRRRRHSSTGTRTYTC